MLALSTYLGHSKLAERLRGRAAARFAFAPHLTAFFEQRLPIEVSPATAQAVPELMRDIADRAEQFAVRGRA
jgi:hypothetical protein